MSEPEKPKKLTKEQRHSMYGVDVAMKHYKEVIYPTQRTWKHGCLSRSYKENYEKINWSKK